MPHEKAVDVIPELVEEAAQQKPTAVEINLSCPNGKDNEGQFHPPLCNNSEASAEVMSKSRERVGNEVTLGAKDSSHAISLTSGVNADAIQDLIAVAINPYADFLTGINTIGNQPFPELVCGNGKGGMSGPVVAGIAHEWLFVARDALDTKIPILSCGGVDSQNAHIEIPLRLKMGAMLVGGAQEFYRAASSATLSERWTQAYASNT